MKDSKELNSKVSQTAIPSKKHLTAGAIQSKIFTIRNLQVMLDEDLATLYGVETKRLNEQVKRNNDRFPESFLFSAD